VEQVAQAAPLFFLIPVRLEPVLVINTTLNSTEKETTEKTDSSPHSKWFRFVKEPLFHFMIMGAAIYLLFGLFGQSESDDEIMQENTIVITEGEIEWLAEMWFKRWNRPPSKNEMVGLVREHLKENVLYREAVSMGLDKDDVIIRRRLAQKLKFVTEDLIQPELPSDKKLKAYFEKHISRYRSPDLVTFTHVFLDPDKRKEKTLDDAKKLKEELITGAKVPDENSNLGDHFALQSYYPERSLADISKLFGDEFAKSVLKLDTKQWHGPVLSGYGTHLVYIQQHQKYPDPDFEQIKTKVREDLINAERKKLNDEYIASLLRRYKVVIEGDEIDEEHAKDLEGTK
jgi:peptidyl-prolyl cis-trans isomerase C